MPIRLAILRISCINIRLNKLMISTLVASFTITSFTFSQLLQLFLKIRIIYMNKKSNTKNPHLRIKIKISLLANFLKCSLQNILKPTKPSISLTVCFIALQKHLIRCHQSIRHHLMLNLDTLAIEQQIWQIRKKKKIFINT